MRRATNLLAIVGAALLVLCVGTASAQLTTETKKFKVVAVEGNQLVVILPEGTKEMTVPEDFRFIVNGQPLSVHELKPGMAGTATITTTTTTRPVTVTEVRQGTVQQVLGSAIIVKTQDGLKMFNYGDVEKRNIRIIRGDRPVQLHELRVGDRLTATIITEKPPQVVTERQVEASLVAERAAGAAGAAGATGTPGEPAAQSARASATSEAALQPPPTQLASSGVAGGSLPTTASPLPLLGLVGAAALAIGAALTYRRRRRPA